jgi:ATP-dependent DNA helicase RecG
MLELSNIKGIGPKTIELLNKLNIYNTNDLITYYPYRYNLIKRSDLSTSNINEQAIIDGTIENIPTVYRFNKKMDKMVFRINTKDNIINATIFNRSFLKNKLLPGTNIILFGKYDKVHNLITVSELRFGILSDIPYIEPVYHSTNGITSKQIKSYIDVVLKQPFNINSNIPAIINEKYDFMDINQSIKEIHNPNASFDKALSHLKYEEAYNFMYKVNELKKKKKHEIGLSRNINYKEVEELLKTLPFELTNDQKIVVEEIYNDLISNKRMNRLLQGDVGSGKTIVAFISMYINYLSNYQSALMVPTDVLAKQHYQSIKKIFKDSINIVLLTGKLKKSEQRKIHNDIENGKVDIIIGTHALIREEVKYHNLGLVITDEQHRFGVNQRLTLQNKGNVPDILYMSATPIPRTYALTLYGDMDVSTIKNSPKGRKEIITTISTSDNIKDVLELMYKELKNNHQVYVIAPLIEESDKIELINISDLEDKMNKAFGKLFKIGTMHGKMEESDKTNIMEKFINNEINILISTTVIEVGVDVANATMIVIFDSFRFGLSTLHQLRGRVGRSDLQAYCILISDMEKERLNILTNTTDGFIISEEDFKLRGSGDLFGVRQSGEMLFKLIDIHNDYTILVKAKEDVEKYC